MPLLETKGAGSAQGFGLSLGGEEAVYIEDVFSTYLYTGNGSTQTITNGIDLSGKGGLVWLKGRSTAGQLPGFFDTQRGVSKFIWSSSTAGQNTFSGFGVTGFGSSGFTIVDDAGGGYWVNGSGITYVSWTFRKQPKFFDVVTYTGNSTNRTIAHNLGSVPGCIIVKNTSGADNWFVQHRSLGATKYIALNDADSAYTNSQIWNNTEPTSTVFSLGTNSGVNQSGSTYVAYLFAHDAGGFGLTGTDNVISCGSYTGNGSNTGPVITLGYEPQWVMIKASSQSGDNWRMFDNMRGMDVNTTGSGDAILSANTSSAEAYTIRLSPTATGFQITDTAGDVNTSGATYIYIAIRRGPMKVPTSGTEVFSPNISSTYDAVNTTGFVVDAQIWADRAGLARNSLVVDRLRGVGTGGSTNDGVFLSTALTDAELGTGSNTSRSWNNTGFRTPGYAGSVPEVFWSFGRAPGFFDEVCYTGNDTARTLAHNLAAVPELMIVKSRSGTGNWSVYVAATTGTNVMYLNTTNASFGASGYWNNTAPTASVFTIGNTGDVNNSGTTFVAYLFATLAGVSKVGSYTGTGTTQVINCGFTAGARFVMIKRTDSTGGWYVWDSTRGIIAGNDPYLLLNSTAAEVTNTDYVDTASTGFEISSTAPAAINANGGSFIFFAVA